MNLLKKKFATALVLVAGLLAGGAATATPITMDFNGLTSGASVDNYYAGGSTKFVFPFFTVKADRHGTDYGVVWKGATVGDDNAGLLVSKSATMNVADGFTGGLSFKYFNLGNLLVQGGVTVYSGQNGNGNVLAQADLASGTAWNFLDLTFSGLAKSVVFGGTPPFFTRFDDVTMGVDAPTAVPEPAAVGVFGLGLLLMGAFVGLRRRYN